MTNINREIYKYTRKDIADMFGVKYGTVCSWLKEHKDTIGHCERVVKKGKAKNFFYSEEAVAFFKKMVNEVN